MKTSEMMLRWRTSGEEKLKRQSTKQLAINTVHLHQSTKNNAGYPQKLWATIKQLVDIFNEYHLHHELNLHQRIPTVDVVQYRTTSEDVVNRLLRPRWSPPSWHGPASMFCCGRILRRTPLRFLSESASVHIHITCTHTLLSLLLG